MIFRDLPYGTSFKRVGYCDENTYIKVLYKDTSKPKAYCLENSTIYNFPTDTQVKTVSSKKSKNYRTETILLNTTGEDFRKLIVNEAQIKMLDYIIELGYDDIMYYNIDEDFKIEDLTKGV